MGSFFSLKCASFLEILTIGIIKNGPMCTQTAEKVCKLFHYNFTSFKHVFAEFCFLGLTTFLSAHKRTWHFYLEF